MSNARSGADFERSIAKLFRDNGYSVCRMAASKGKLGHWDADIIVSKQTGQTKYEIGIAIMQMKRTKLR